MTKAGLCLGSGWRRFSIHRLLDKLSQVTLLYFSSDRGVCRMELGDWGYREQSFFSSGSSQGPLYAQIHQLMNVGYRR